MKKILRNSWCGVFVCVVLSIIMGGVSSSNATALSDANMRLVRLRATFLDRSGNCIQNVKWNTKGDWKEITKSQRISGYMMCKYLLIPGTPWIQWQNEIHIAVGKEARIEKIGEERFHPLKVQGQKESQLMMWKTTYTDGKWVGIDRDKIFECSDDGVGRQIGWLAFRHLTIDTGETVLVQMTKGMEAEAMWEGDAGDTAYRRKRKAKGRPLANWNFALSKWKMERRL